MDFIGNLLDVTPVLIASRLFDCDMSLLLSRLSNFTDSISMR